MHIIDAILSKNKQAMLDAINADRHCLNRMYNLIEQNGTASLVTNPDRNYLVLDPLGCALMYAPDLAATLLNQGAVIKQCFSVGDHGQQITQFITSNLCNSPMLESVLKLVRQGFRLHRMGFNQIAGLNSANPFDRSSSPHEKNLWKEIFTENLKLTLIDSFDFRYCEFFTTACSKQNASAWGEAQLKEAFIKIISSRLNSEQRLRLADNLNSLAENKHITKEQKDDIIAKTSDASTMHQEPATTSTPFNALIREFLFTTEYLSTNLTSKDYEKLSGPFAITEESINNGTITDEEKIQHFRDSQKTDNECMHLLLEATHSSSDNYMRTFTALLVSKNIAHLCSQIFYHPEASPEVKNNLSYLLDEYNRTPRHAAAQAAQTATLIHLQRETVKQQGELIALQQQLVALQMQGPRLRRSSSELFQSAPVNQVTSESAEKRNGVTASP